MSQALWAYAEAGEHHSSFFTEVARTSLLQAEHPSFHARDIASIAWAFGALKFATPEISEALAYLGLITIRRQTPEGMSKTVWAMARLGHRDPELLDEAATYLTKRTPEFNNEDLVSAVWAMVTLGGVERRGYYHELAKLLRFRVPGFTTE